MRDRREFYDRLFTTGESDSWDAAPGKRVILGAVLNAIPLDTKARLLDVGCGSGFLLCQIVARRPRVDAFGIDFAISAIRRGSESHSELRLSCQDASKLAFVSDSFDVVISYGSLEHFPNPGQALHEIGRVLCPGGHFFFMTPALGVDRTDRNDEGWYEERVASGATFQQLQWNLTRATWADSMRRAQLKVAPAHLAVQYGAVKPGVFFFGRRADEMAGRDGVATTDEH